MDILLSLYDSNYPIQKKLDIIFAGLEDDPEKIAAMIQEEITFLKEKTDFVDYYEADSLADHLDDLRLNIANDLNAKSVKIAFEMMLDFLDLHDNTLGRVDDSRGSVGNVFSTACKDLSLLAQNIHHLNHSPGFLANQI